MPLSARRAARRRGPRAFRADEALATYYFQSSGPGGAGGVRRHEDNLATAEETREAMLQRLFVIALLLGPAVLLAPDGGPRDVIAAIEPSVVRPNRDG